MGWLYQGYDHRQVPLRILSFLCVVSARCQCCGRGRPPLAYCITNDRRSKILKRCAVSNFILLGINVTNLHGAQRECDSPMVAADAFHNVSLAPPAPSHIRLYAFRCDDSTSNLVLLLQHSYRIVTTRTNRPALAGARAWPRSSACVSASASAAWMSINPPYLTRISHQFGAT
ncbi:hypothetical protein K437DRAFT_24778 [Tilletiaria anomala UBC 951]|uniref:Uncharacterized protein n=1 Tax=Tilletiaria anomala (strain ATCC 24038 / CBS 436.72 / UBC 951) TaxID=1037660 RepID=A0A066WE44_TILAU|nr:uncharacterized protein K437DRAFT_24778 [Tilletiaria anomala UBC 951]KDN52227.1 hypothetical protein K437DRAFT_24778 [Tilletiaria anomala UBC 951]